MVLLIGCLHGWCEVIPLGRSLVLLDRAHQGASIIAAPRAALFHQSSHVPMPLTTSALEAGFIDAAVLIHASVV